MAVIRRWLLYTVTTIHIISYMYNLRLCIHFGMRVYDHGLIWFPATCRLPFPFLIFSSKESHTQKVRKGEKELGNTYIRLGIAHPICAVAHDVCRLLPFL